MSTTALLAGLAAACAVLATWDGMRVAEQILPRAPQVLAPWRHVGRYGTPPNDPEVRRLVVIVAVSSGGAGWILWGPLAGLAGMLGSPVLVRRAIAARRERWRRAAAAGAPFVARGVADALCGGHSPRGALAEVAACGGAGQEADEALRAVGRALALGEPTDDVLRAWRDRMRTPAYDMLASSILLQRDAGGDLVALLRDVAADMEGVRRSTADARAVTAQARFTAGIVCALPVGAAALVELFSPGSLGAMLAEPLPRLMTLAALVLEAVALVAIRRLARVAG